MRRRGREPTVSDSRVSVLCGNGCHTDLAEGSSCWLGVAEGRARRKDGYVGEGGWTV